VDVQSPHQPIHTLKDFFVHLLTITVGLFIALTLEAAVESMHHRHLVRVARENLRMEITSNHHLYADNARNLQENREQLARDIDQLRDLRDGKKVQQPNLGWAWYWNSYNDAEWKAARESGAVSYMDSSTITAYSSIYSQQEYINSTALAIVSEETRAGAALQVAKDPSKLLPTEIETMLIDSAAIDQSFRTLQSTMKALDDMYTEQSNSPR
jgi:hypothetical protein